MKKIAEITNEVNITWKYCSKKLNLADLGGANIGKLESQAWLIGPDWLLTEDEWPEQPELKGSNETLDEQKATQPVFFCNEQERDEWDDLLDRSSYWRTLRVTAWMLRFVNNCRSKTKKVKSESGPLNTDEIMSPRNRWIRRVQRNDQPNLRSPGWTLVREAETEILRCEGRAANYQPIYLGGGTFENKLIMHVHNRIIHPGIANTMAALRETWWIPRLRAKVKKVMNKAMFAKFILQSHSKLQLPQNYQI